MDPTREALLMGRLTMIDLLVQSSLVQLLIQGECYLLLLQNKLAELGGQPYWAFPFS
jgi:hypothetical protein